MALLDRGEPLCKAWAWHANRLGFQAFVVVARRPQLQRRAPDICHATHATIFQPLLAWLLFQKTVNAIVIGPLVCGTQSFGSARLYPERLWLARPSQRTGDRSLFCRARLGSARIQQRGRRPPILLCYYRTSCVGGGQSAKPKRKASCDGAVRSGPRELRCQR